VNKDKFLNIKTIFQNFPEESVAPGNAGCPGCGAVLAIRLAMKVLGTNTWGVLTTGCMAVNYTAPKTGVARSPWVHPLFGNAAALASGLDIALELRNIRNNVNLLVVGGDGGTADIGFQGLSAAFGRNQHFLYLCYDNGAYMNTGGQKSGTTDYYAQTKSLMNTNFPRDLPKIFQTHNIPYLATANIAFPKDFMEKVHSASKCEGSSYLHVLTPCVPGWGIDSSQTIEVAHLAVTTGYQILYETNKGKKTLSQPSFKYQDEEKREPIEKYFEKQKRFKNLLSNEKELSIVKKYIKANWLDFLKDLIENGKD
jgi:pyruvate ferredoxin oxidoreductase beta subunit